MATSSARPKLVKHHAAPAPSVARRRGGIGKKRAVRKSSSYRYSAPSRPLRFSRIVGAKAWLSLAGGNGGEALIGEVAQNDEQLKRTVADSPCS